MHFTKGRWLFVIDNRFSVSLLEIKREFKLDSLYEPENIEDVKICNNEVNRPSLQIAGFFEYFDNTRVQVICMVEISYLKKMDEDKRMESLETLFMSGIPAIVLTRDLEPFEEMIHLAKKYSVPLLRSHVSTSRFLSALIAYLNLHLAPRLTMHGVLVEVYGEGILLLGDSGVGKSETAIELVKRGHRLVADDAVEIKRVSDISLVGSAPSIIKHFVELRGIGIVDVRQIFGMGAIKETEKIDMIIHLEPWQDKKQYDRLGLNTEYDDILGVNIPSLTVPVKPGRNLAVVVEVAAMNNRQKKLGYNAAEELNKRLNLEMELN
jgi:HPr kinase/phosphorylase